MKNLMQDEWPAKLNVVFDRVLTEQKAGRAFSLGELLNELHRACAGDPQDRTASAIISALGDCQFGPNPAAAGALAIRRLELVAIIAKEQAARVIHQVDVRLDVDGPSRQISLAEAPSARLAAALEELEAIDRRPA